MRSLRKPARLSATIAGIAVAAMVFTTCTSGVSGASTHHRRKGASGAPKTLVLGATLPLTGSGAPYGKTFEGAMNIAVNYINHHGGVNGSKIKVVALTDKGLAAPAVLDAKQLISADHAMMIATAYDDPPLAEYKIGKRYGVPIVNGGGNTPTLLNKPYLWTTASIFTNEEVVAFTYEKAHGVKKVGSIAATNYTNAALSAYHKIVNKIFGGTQKMVTFTPTSTNVTSQLEELQSSHPTVISPVSSGTLSLTVAEDMHNLGLKTKVAGIDGMFTVPATIVKQPAWTGAIAGVPVAPPSSWLNTGTERVTGHPATNYSTYFANIPFLLKDAVVSLEHQHKTVNGKDINRFLEQAAKKRTAVAGSNGKMKFLPSHIADLAYTVSQIENGKVKVLQTLNPAQVAKEAKKAGA